MLQEALAKGLLPGLLAELRGRLAAEAREVVSQRAAKALWDIASAAPLKVRRVLPPLRHQSSRKLLETP